jgi:hypothetical protein
MSAKNMDHDSDDQETHAAPGQGVWQASEQVTWSWKRGLSFALVGALGALLGAVATVLLLARTPSTPDPLPALPQPPTPSKAGQKDSPDLRGTAEAKLRNFEIHDLQGHRVLHVDHFSAELDLEDMQKRVMRLSKGRVKGVDVLLRRGESGRISLAEVLGRDPQKKRADPEERRELALGPFQIEDARLRIMLGMRPVTFQIDRAQVRITRGLEEKAPKIFLSGIHGRMVDPDPLPQPIRIVGGEGVVDLARDPLVDVRARVCIGNGELRMHVGLPDSRQPVNLRAEAEGFMGKAALMALGLAANIKDEKITLSNGPVQVAAEGDCSRSEGRDLKRALKDAE